MDSLSVFASASGAFVLTVAAIFAMRPLASAIDLVDKPGGRKRHRGIVPVVGGIGILLGTLYGLSSYHGVLGGLQHYLYAAILITVTGIIDDRFHIDHKIRLLVQFVALLPMFYGAHIQFLSFGDLLGTGPLLTGGFSIAATAVVVLGAINAFNMLDGLDGLAGGIALMTLILMLELPGLSGHPESVLLITVLASAIAGFLVFNLPIQINAPIRCFMGDAGSTLLGFSLAWLMISLSQGSAKLASPITMVWLTTVPVTDLVWTVSRRLSRGQSPFQPDRGHLHHLLIDGGFNVRAVFAFLTGCAALFGTIGLTLERAHTPEWQELLAWCLSAISLVAVCGAIRKRQSVTTEI